MNITPLLIYIILTFSLTSGADEDSNERDLMISKEATNAVDLVIGLIYQNGKPSIAPVDWESAKNLTANLNDEDSEKSYDDSVEVFDLNNQTLISTYKSGEQSYETSTNLSVTQLNNVPQNIGGVNNFTDPFGNKTEKGIDNISYLQTPESSDTNDNVSSTNAEKLENNTVTMLNSFSSTIKPINHTIINKNYKLPEYHSGVIPFIFNATSDGERETSPEIFFSANIEDDKTLFVSDNSLSSFSSISDTILLNTGIENRNFAYNLSNTIEPITELNHSEVSNATIYSIIVRLENSSDIFNVSASNTLTKNEENDAHFVTQGISNLINTNVADNSTKISNFTTSQVQNNTKAPDDVLKIVSLLVNIPQESRMALKNLSVCCNSSIEVDETWNIFTVQKESGANGKDFKILSYQNENYEEEDEDEEFGEMMQFLEFFDNSILSKLFWV